MNSHVRIRLVLRKKSGLFGPNVGDFIYRELEKCYVWKNRDFTIEEWNDFNCGRDVITEYVNRRERVEVVVDVVGQPATEADLERERMVSAALRLRLAAAEQDLEELRLAIAPPAQRKAMLAERQREKAAKEAVATTA